MEFVVVDVVDDVTAEEPEVVVLDEMPLCPDLVEVEFRTMIEVEVEFMLYSCKTSGELRAGAAAV